MKRILALLVSVTIAFNFAAAQSQQLKTFHSFCPGSAGRATRDFRGAASRRRVRNIRSPRSGDFG